MGPYQLNIKRGLVAALVAGSVAFAVPWLLLSLLLWGKWLGIDVDPSRDGAWLGAYFLTSIVATAACVSFGTSPKASFVRDAALIAGVTIVISSVATIVQGPRYKSEPPFGEGPADIALLTVPAVATGVAILAWRTLRARRDRSETTAKPTSNQP
jgi:hypothetical protein